MDPEAQAAPGRAAEERQAGQERAGRSRRRGRRRIAIVVVVSLVNVALLALLVSQLLIPAQNPSGTGGNQGSSPLLGHPAPDFTLPTLSSQPAPAVHLASLKGKAVVLNFWASWCVPCQQEAPTLEQAWQQVRAQGVVFIGIDFQDTQSDGLSFLQRYGITYPNVVDQNGATAINYGLTGVPETVFIDRRGVIVQKVIGQLSTQTVQNNLRVLLYCFRERMICCKEELEATRDSLSGAAEPSDAPRTV